MVDAKDLGLFIAIGHGVSLDGSWDPGTVYDIDRDGKVEKSETEAALMLPIGKAAVKYLKWSGFTVYTDAYGNDGKTSSDDNNMNMVKCIQRANKLKVDAYISLHCDWYKAQSGTLPLYHPSSKQGKALANAINKAVMADMNMKTRGLSARKDLGELNDTNMIACIFETGSIKNDAKKLKDADDYGKAIARGICNYYGVKLVTKEPSKSFKVVAKGNLLVRKSESLESAKVRTLSRGKIYTIVETNEKKTRGKLKEGGWITITSKYVDRV